MRTRFNFLLPQFAAITLILFASRTSLSQGAYDGSGSWLALDGVGDYAVVSDNSSLDVGNAASEDFTIECLFHIPNLDSNNIQTLIYKSSSYDLYLIMSSSSQDRIVLRVYTGPLSTSYQYLVSYTDLSVGWHHVAAVYVNAPATTMDTLKIYLDGALVGSSNRFGVDPGIYNSSGSLYVGGYVGYSSFYGGIDEIRISDAIRYSGWSYTVPSSDFSVDSHTRALWHFSESVGSTTFNDATTNNNTLTGIGANVVSPVHDPPFTTAQNGPHFVLEQNYPNPFNPSTVIRYSLPTRSVVRLAIFNSLGQEVRQLVDAEQSAGYHEITWQPAVSSGFYIYRIDAIAVENPRNHFAETRKALFIR